MAALTVPTSARPEKEQRTRATHDRKATASGPVVPHTIRPPLPNSREGTLVGEFVRLEVDEASRVGTIRLDRPPVNALNAQIQDELVEAGRRCSPPGPTSRR
jgi:hypothetical protein